MVHGHEDGVDDNTQRDEQVDEGVHDDHFNDVRELMPGLGAAPAKYGLPAQVFYNLLHGSLGLTVAGNTYTRSMAIIITTFT